MRFQQLQMSGAVPLASSLRMPLGGNPKNRQPNVDKIARKLDWWKSLAVS